MPQKDQQFIFTKEELSLIKNTFAGDDTLLYTIRKVLLQFSLTEVEKGLLHTSITPDVLRVLRKRMLPDLSPEFPLGQLSDLTTTLTKDLQNRPVEDVLPLIKAKKIEKDYIAQQFAALVDPEAPQPIRLTDLGAISGTEEDFVNLTAYLFLLGYIDPSLVMIRVIAGTKEETPEEQTARLTQDSSK